MKNIIALVFFLELLFLDMQSVESICPCLDPIIASYYPFLALSLLRVPLGYAGENDGRGVSRSVVRCARQVNLTCSGVGKEMACTRLIDLPGRPDEGRR